MYLNPSIVHHILLFKNIFRLDGFGILNKLTGFSFLLRRRKHLYPWTSQHNNISTCRSSRKRSNKAILKKLKYIVSHTKTFIFFVSNKSSLNFSLTQHFGPPIPMINVFIYARASRHLKTQKCTQI